MTDEQRAIKIKALIEERDGAARKGRDDLVAQIDDQLRRIGGEPPARRAAKRKRTP